MANKNFRVRHGLDIGNSVSITDAGTATGITTLASVSNGNITLAPNGTGDVLLTADTIQVGDSNADATITTNGTGDLILNTNAGSSSGSITIADGANSNITVATNGTGDVALSFSNGGNLTNTRNYITGAIRNSTTEGLGDIWALNASTTSAPFRGVSLDNSTDTTRGPGTILRSYSGGAVAGAGTRGRLVFERSRGTAASPSAVQSGDQLGSIDATGYTSTGWINNTLTVVPAFFGFSAAENWVSNTNMGVNFSLSLAPTATTVTTNTNLVQTLLITPQTSIHRSDTFIFRQGKTGTTDLMTIDVNGNVAITGDLRVNGNDIKSSDNTVQITTSAAGSTLALKGNTITLESVDGTDYLVLDTNEALFSKVVRTKITTASIAQGATYTPAAGALNSIILEITAGSGTTTIDVSNLTVAGENGVYDIMVYNNSGGSINANGFLITNGGNTVLDHGSSIANGARAIFEINCIDIYANAQFVGEAV